MSEKRDTIVFTGGGTGGHIYPGLAVIEALKSMGFEGRIAWIGSKKGLDRNIVEAQGVEFWAIPSGKLRRSLNLRNVTDAFNVVAGYFAAKRLLQKLKPTAVFSKGGYVSVPVCRAASRLGIPYFTHESDTSPGLATKLNAKAAKAILVSWPQTKEMFIQGEQAKVLVTGNPVRPSLLSGSAEAGKAFIKAPEGLPIVFFVGGSQGSQQVNDFVEAILPNLVGKAYVVHQTGKELFNPQKHSAQPGNYLPLPYIGEEMKDILASATVVAGRAGAGTIWECAALGKPMVLVPLAGSGTRGDQVENAMLAEKAGAARCLVGRDAHPQKLLDAILEYLQDPALLAKAQRAALELSQVHTDDGRTVSSASYIAELLLQQINKSSASTGK